MGTDVIEGWESLVRYHRTVTGRMDAELRTRFGSSLDHYDVLYQLSAQESPLRMGELAERLLIANSSCHRLVGALVRAGFVRRERGRVDRREVLVSLTPEGRRQWRRMAAVHTRDIERWFGDPLTAAEHDTLAALLAKLTAADQLGSDPS